VIYPLVGNWIGNEKINLSSGVRQGDPISDLLFNLSMEPLLRFLDNEGIQSLSYADDLGIILI